ncbi:hypothetical protein B0O80DRAFT_85469 [Mortierella sp. GBAus27b]|nr:hypothetical protein B0O80DRAFT_85469 [Mortierella sp. GBAus27b]
MLGIPELDDLICRYLSPHDLTQCAQVNRKWLTAVMPQLWNDLSWIGDASVSQQQAFLKLILEDYLQEQHRRGLQLKDGNMDQSVQAQSSTLAKYRYWIRVLPHLPAYDKLDSWLAANSNKNNSTQRQHLVSQGNELTTRELLLHLFKQCNTADVVRYSLGYRTIQSYPVEKAIAEHVLPRVHRLCVMAACLQNPRELGELKQLLSPCSTKLETLVLNVSLSPYRDYEESFNDDEDEEQQPHESTDWTSFKNLVLCRVWYDDHPQSIVFWSWIYERCKWVEKIEIRKLHRGSASIFAKDMLIHMPNLTEITIGTNTRFGGRSPITTVEIALLLGVSAKGWKVVKLKNTRKFGKDAMSVLEQHFSTLEEFHVKRARSCPSAEDLVHLLSSCPNLHTFILEENQFDAQSFIDKNPVTGLLNTWACESSLKVLEFQLGGTQSQDIFSGNGNENDINPRQGREVESLVFDRLARLANLEILSLGTSPRMGSRLCRGIDECELSLESGLDKLSGLKKLKEFSVLEIKARIGVQEVQWMVEHWPRLRVINGLDRDGANKDAVEWLEEHCPKIVLGPLQQVGS